ncbi:hypothetical protein AB0A74_04455 [Saccharothrix sp. NPDC042600]|uniref:hypothetical protein n=1 Tax=Saccharothrix TaxID=2071 RepID=UPI0033E51EC8|nr:hypothetical protein GCM10017745_00610 [Saccharothrix mutabilis subsp. capreolus]
MAKSEVGLLDRVQSFAAIAAPTTLATALLFYFGYVATLTRYRYFGVDLGALDLSTAELLLLGTEVVLPPLVGLLLLVMAALLAHRAVRLLHRGRWARPVGAVLVAVGAVAFGRAVVGVLFPSVSRHETPGLTAVCLGLGLPLVAYGLWVYRGAPPARRRTPSEVLLLTALTGMVVLGLFWATNIFAGGYGRGRAVQDARELHDRPVVVLDLAQPLYLPENLPGVHQFALPAQEGNPFRVRCQGLRLLTEAGGRLFLVPERWEGGARTVVVPYDSEVRVQFLPGANP